MYIHVDKDSYPIWYADRTPLHYYLTSQIFPSASLPLMAIIRDGDLAKPDIWSRPGFIKTEFMQK